MGRTLAAALFGLFALGGASAAEAGCDIGATTDPATAAQAEFIAAALPLAFVGSFQWDGSIDEQPVAFSFYGCVVGGKVRLIGQGLYVDSGTEITLVGEVSGAAITLYERDPRGGTAPFVIDGRHEGEIAPDLSRICAVWSMDDGSGSGRLRLGATPEDAARCFEPLNIS